MKRYYLNTDPIVTYEDISNDGNYVDKTGLIAFVNSKVRNPRRLILVSRPRRFGKMYTAMMLKAYYTIGYDTTFLFKDKKIFQIDPGLTHRGEFDVIYIDMVKFRARAKARQNKLDKAAKRKGVKPEKLDWIDFLTESIVKEITGLYGKSVVAD